MRLCRAIVGLIMILGLAGLTRCVHPKECRNTRAAVESARTAEVGMVRERK